MSEDKRSFKRLELLKLIAIGTFLFGLVLVAVGVWLFYVGAAGQMTEIEMLGNTLRTTSVGLVVFFMGSVVVVALIRRVLDTMKSWGGVSKSQSMEHPASRALRDSSEQPPSSEAVGTGPSQVSGYKVIGFDLDGTLLRGLEFSWTLVWDYLRFPEAVRKAGMHRYLTRETTYQEWCEWACGQFREKGLKRSDFVEIAAPLTVTNNLREVITTLKADGFVVGLISGGIDVLLHEKIPDADELFDYVFINRLLFDSEGVIDGVKVTPYDFEGKAVALEKMCTDNGFTLNNAVFVGEGFNDQDVASRAALSIAYPPVAQGMRETASIQIEEDDLRLILSHVIA